MDFNDNFNVDSESELIELKEQLLTIQASNIALAAIIAQLPETAKLDIEDVKQSCAVMSDMDAHTEMVTGQFAASIIEISRQIKNLDE